MLAIIKVLLKEALVSILGRQSTSFNVSPVTPKKIYLKKSAKAFLVGLCVGKTLPTVGWVGHPGGVAGGSIVKTVAVLQSTRPRQGLLPLVFVQQRVILAILEAYRVVERHQDVQQVVLGQRKREREREKKKEER